MFTSYIYVVISMNQILSDTLEKKMNAYDECVKNKFYPILWKRK